MKSVFRENFFLYLRGLAMGAADVVPGVSGGTIAFITGIYPRLINAIRNVGTLQTLREILSFQIKAFWNRVDGLFLLVLFFGVFTSLIGLANFITHLMQAYELQLWAFFFGLVLASAVLIAWDLKPKFGMELMWVLAGAFMGYGVSMLTPTQLSGSLPEFFLAGVIGICAMILPGISGSLLLLLLGMYGPLITAIANLEWAKIVVFNAGSVVGLLSFSHLLHWALNCYKRQTFAVLVGVMFGSLSKLWPWKETLQTMVDRHGEIVPLLQGNISPWAFAQLQGVSNQWQSALLMALVGIIVIFGLDRLVKGLRP